MLVGKRPVDVWPVRFLLRQAVIFDEDFRSAIHDPLRAKTEGGITAGLPGGAAARTWRLRVTSGPGDPTSTPGRSYDAHAGNESYDREHLFLNQAIANRKFTVLSRCDRMAVCLKGAIGGADENTTSPVSNKTSEQNVGGQQLSEPCVSGTIQLPPDGNPVIMLAEHQTTGGYKVAGVVVQADLWMVGQARPNDFVEFAPVSLADAVEALEIRKKQAEEFCLDKISVSSGSGSRPPLLRERICLDYIDLNADAGEGYDDASLLKFVTSVNIACGGHTGSPETMARTVALACAAGATIGAHPSYVDKENWGRKKVEVNPETLRAQVIAQVGALIGICRLLGAEVSYVKPHGALYHTVVAGTAGGTGGAGSSTSVDENTRKQAQAVVDAAAILGLPLLLMPKSRLASFGEGFAERAYDGDSLRARDKPGAVIHDPKQAAAQAVELASQPNIHSICVHSDSPGAVAVARAVRRKLDEGFTVKSFLNRKEAGTTFSSAAGSFGTAWRDPKRKFVVVSEKKSSEHGYQPGEDVVNPDPPIQHLQRVVH